MSNQRLLELRNINEANRSLFEMNYDYWIEHVIFSFNWWFLLLICIIPWIVWWKLVPKNKLLEILFLGGIVMVIAVTFDSFGVSFSYWSYGYKFVQMTTPLIPIDLSLLPITHMLIYQWFQNWKPFIVAHTVLAVLGSFMAEPLFVWLGIYELHSWKHIYSLPIYIAVGISTKWLIMKIKQQVSAEL